MKKKRAIDFFCGAGGFSEGFRQQGFDIIMGIDNWRPAVQTHNLNHGLNDEVMDVLDYEGDISKIDALPNTEIVIGSPPCVTFSMSNRAGKADKSLGIRLIEAYLRVVAVKKHQPCSILKAWLMENVPNSRNFVQEKYTFEDLNLAEWAKGFGRSPDEVALFVKNNGDLLTASDYGSPQSRTRFVCGEVVGTGKFPYPIKTRGNKEEGLLPHLTLGDIKRRMPSPLNGDKGSSWEDPNYPGLVLDKAHLTDHFYDTGVYEVEWSSAREAKLNHPFMGRMSFPEDENRPSRTIMATRSASTREAIIFRSELDRKGDGEYRLPTIREAATLMGFPYNYQFTGSEGTKWRLIGNAVCPHMSSALARAILTELDHEVVPLDQVKFKTFDPDLLSSIDLRVNSHNNLSTPPKKNKGARFRSHPFKSGNMTVALMNFDPVLGSQKGTNGSRWYPVVFSGSGIDYRSAILDHNSALILKSLIEQQVGRHDLIDALSLVFEGKVATASVLQTILEENATHEGDLLSPSKLVDLVRSTIDALNLKGKVIENLTLPGFSKHNVPLEQIYAMYAMLFIVELINRSCS